MSLTVPPPTKLHCSVGGISVEFAAEAFALIPTGTQVLVTSTRNFKIRSIVSKAAKTCAVSPTRTAGLFTTTASLRTTEGVVDEEEVRCREALLLPCVGGYAGWCRRRGRGGIMWESHVAIAIGVTTGVTTGASVDMAADEQLAFYWLVHGRPC